MARLELVFLLSDRLSALDLGRLVADGVDPDVALGRLFFTLERPELDRLGLGMHDDLDVDDPDLPI